MAVHTKRGKHRYIDTGTKAAAQRRARLGLGLPKDKIYIWALQNVEILPKLNGGMQNFILFLEERQQKKICK